jgi:hypothetical protein
VHIPVPYTPHVPHAPHRTTPQNKKRQEVAHYLLKLKLNVRLTHTVAYKYDLYVYLFGYDNYKYLKEHTSIWRSSVASVWRLILDWCGLFVIENVFNGRNQQRSKWLFNA